MNRPELLDLLREVLESPTIADGRVTTPFQVWLKWAVFGAGKRYEDKRLNADLLDRIREAVRG